MQLPQDPQLELKRRTFLSSAGIGLGSLALSSLAGRDAGAKESLYPALPGLPHFAAKAKRVIFLCMAGGPSHL